MFLRVLTNWVYPVHEETKEQCMTLYVEELVRSLNRRKMRRITLPFCNISSQTRYGEVKQKISILSAALITNQNFDRQSPRKSIKRHNRFYLRTRSVDRHCLSLPFSGGGKNALRLCLVVDTCLGESDSRIRYRLLAGHFAEAARSRFCYGK